MDRLVQMGKIAFGVCAVSWMMAACSDDGSSASSKVVESMELWKTERNTSELVADIHFIYGKDGRLAQVSSDDAGGVPLMDINYVYSENNDFQCVYTGDGGQRGRISATLENGRIYSCQNAAASGTESYTYVYTDDGYLRKCDSREASFEYAWSGGNLLSVKSSERAYNSTYETASVANDYSIDLNVLPHLITGADYMEAMNTYCWLAGVLGKKSRNIAEDTLYTYDYKYDGEGRLSEIVMQETLSFQDVSYTFRFVYPHNG